MSEVVLPPPPQAELAPSPEAARWISMTGDQVARLRQITVNTLVGTENPLASGVTDSLFARAAADALTAGLQEAIAADPTDGYPAVAGYRGPVAEIVRHAGDVYNNQTGGVDHSLRFSGFSGELIQDAQDMLAAARARLADRRWDGTHTNGTRAGATTGHRRREVALQALRGMAAIAETSGQVAMTEATARSIHAALTQSPKR